MKITDDIIYAIDQTIKMFGSKKAFAKQANINATTLSRYINRKRISMTEDSWEKIYPFIKDHLPHIGEKSELPDYYKKIALSCDQRILLDTFAQLPKKLQEQKLIEIIELAKQHLDD